MRISTPDYRRGIQSLNNFMDMLQDAMYEALSGADLARTSGFGWRGYQIRKFKELAGGQYYCQIYLNQPQILNFKESYYTGVYVYPWRMDHDLVESGFYEKEDIQQKEELISFIQESANHALYWQQSEKRKLITPAQFLKGREFEGSADLKQPAKVYRVSRSCIYSTIQLGNIFRLLKEIIEQEASIGGLRKPFIMYNASGWNYRGLWMKMRTDEPEYVEPEGSFPYMWKVKYYEDPAQLWFEGTNKEISLDLDFHFYFTLDEENQQKTLRNFVKPIMEEIKMEMN